MQIKNSIALILLTVVISLITACDDKVKPEPVGIEHEQPQVVALSKIVTSTPQADALAQLQLGNQRLWGYQTRAGLIIPGIEQKQAAALAEAQGIQIAPGMGDVIYDDVHKALRKSFRQYAASYNQAIIAHR